MPDILLACWLMPVTYRLGEVGLDRIFRIPFVPLYSEGDLHEGNEDENDTKDSTRSPRLSPFHVPLEHQLAILEAQIGLAIEFKRNISMHSVKAQQASMDLLKRLVKQYGDRFHAISFDFHSCGLSADMWSNIQVCFRSITTFFLVGLSLFLCTCITLLCFSESPQQRFPVPINCNQHAFSRPYSSHQSLRRFPDISRV